MHTKASLLQDLKQPGINQRGTLLVHSSMKAIGQVNGGAETVLDSLIELMKEGLLILPTHTWSENNLKGHIYDPQTEPSCVGILTNLFLKRPQVFRSLHPTHSVAAIGKRAKNYIDHDNYPGKPYTPCPRNGCFGSLYDENGELLFLGASLKTNTFIHSVEEWLEIPDRIQAEPETVKIRLGENHFQEVQFHRHYCSKGDISLNYDRIEGDLLKKRIAQKITIGDAKSYLVKVRPLADMLVSILKNDPDYFVA
ncbi:MAG: AAC(3) family N-acetyltransferase [Spirochaetes bacterium]|nr:AAC(3) family N-acetyltransferase [Spirochaetota bacterium]